MTAGGFPMVRERRRHPRTTQRTQRGAEDHARIALAPSPVCGRGPGRRPVASSEGASPNPNSPSPVAARRPLPPRGRGKRVPAQRKRALQASASCFGPLSRVRERAGVREWAHATRIARSRAVTYIRRCAPTLPCPVSGARQGLPHSPFASFAVALFRENNTASAPPTASRSAAPCGRPRCGCRRRVCRWPRTGSCAPCPATAPASRRCRRCCGLRRRGAAPGARGR